MMAASRGASIHGISAIQINFVSQRSARVAAMAMIVPDTVLQARIVDMMSQRHVGSLVEVYVLL